MVTVKTPIGVRPRLNIEYYYWEEWFDRRKDGQ